MLSTRDIIATMGTTMPVAALSLVVNPDEIFPPAELVVGLEETRFEGGNTNVVELNGFPVAVDSGVDVMLIVRVGPVAI